LVGDVIIIDDAAASEAVFMVAVGSVASGHLMQLPPILSRDQVRDIDRRAIQEYGLSGLVLMENAARGTADVLCGLMEAAGAAKGPVTIVCGKGNNGGDGFAIARHLDLRSITTKLVLLCDPNELTGDAAANFAIAEKAGISIKRFSTPLDTTGFDRAISGSAWLVDAILGTGAVGEPRSPFAEAIERMNASKLPILAIDLPSGLDCNTGVAASRTIKAAHTCTFVAAKPGFFIADGPKHVGTLHAVDIGAPRKLIESALQAASAG
jgi:NAD(P)H-hydrate epimerase